MHSFIVKSKPMIEKITLMLKKRPEGKCYFQFRQFVDLFALRIDEEDASMGGGVTEQGVTGH